MLRRATHLSLLFLGTFALLWGISLGYVRSSDLKAVQLREEQESRAASQGVFSTTHQKRRGVVKEIWFTQEDSSRLHYRIASESSLLTMQPYSGKKFDIIENLEKIKCWMQDRLYASQETTPMQQVRFLEAKDGIYRYTSQQFLAQSVALSLFRLPGHELPHEISASPFLKGLAQDVSFGVSGKTPQFTAKHFKAQLNESP